MPGREDVTALMASDGDYEKKISVLKKAVVVVTKQKQLLEEQNQQLRGQLARISEELSQAQELSSRLQKRVQASEMELEALKKKSLIPSGLPFNMGAPWKGLSSLVASASPMSDAGAAGGDGGRKKKGDGATQAILQLSPEDHEKLIEENHALHMQLFDIRNQHDASVKLANSAQSSVEAKQKELEEITAVVQQLTDKVDELHLDGARQRAIAGFCQHLFTVTQSRRGSTGGGSGAAGTELELAISAAALRKRGGTLATDVREELLFTYVKRTTNALTTVLRCVSVMLVALRDAVPVDLHGTASEVRWATDRLRGLIEAHDSRKERLTVTLKEIVSLLCPAGSTAAASEAASHAETELRPAGPATRAAAGAVHSGGGGGSGPTVAMGSVLDLQLSLFRGFGDWLHVMQQHAPLLVRCCCAHLLSAPTGAHGGPEKPSECVANSIAQRLLLVLSSLQGVLEVLTTLCHSSASVISSMEEDAVEWMVSLQQFLWEGWKGGVLPYAIAHGSGHGAADGAAGRVGSSTSVTYRSLHECLGELHSLLTQLSTSSRMDQVQIAIRHLASSLAALAPVARTAVKERPCDTAEPAAVLSSPSVVAHAPAPSAIITRLTAAVAAALHRDPARSSSPDTAPLASDEAEEIRYGVISSLLAADRAAIAYHTQLSYVLLELVKKEREVSELQSENGRMELLMRQQSDDTEKMREALETQIRVLSDQLVEANDAQER